MRPFSRLLYSEVTIEQGPLIRSGQGDNKMRRTAYAGVVAFAFAVLIALTPTPTMAQVYSYPAFVGPSHQAFGNELTNSIIDRGLIYDEGGANFGVAATAGAWQQPAGAGSGSKRSNARSRIKVFHDPAEGQEQMNFWNFGYP
jgi:hypothetical protein